jgi:hypothetical protein
MTSRFERPTFISTLLITLLINLLITLALSAPAMADSDLETKFQDMFVTAGYSAAAGAAIGAAILTFQDQPTKHLKFISIGASLGFLSGTALGAWYTVIPAFVDNERPSPVPLPVEDAKTRIVLRPWLDTGSQKLRGVEAGAVIASF